MRKIDVAFLSIIILAALIIPISLVVSHQQTKTDTIAIDARIGEDGGWSVKTIHAKVGEDLVLKLESQDVMHSFVIDELNINVSLYPGHVVYVHIPTDKAGTYTYYCGIYCSPRHFGMSGTLYIE